MVDVDALATFQAQRGRMFGIAYRMLGSATDAEDVLQDAWLRWQATDRDAVRDPAAFLATMVTRLCLTALDSARARREVYVGPWLPEPIPTGDDPAVVAEHAESISLAVLLLLERLTPMERAVYVLHEAFDYPFAQIAELLEISEANARQLGSRARRHLDDERGQVVDPAERARLLAAITEAAQAGDIATLESMLAEDAVAVSDGGGVVRAARKAVHGRERVAAFILGVLEKFAADVEPRFVEVNGEPALIGVRDGHVMAMWTVDITTEGVRRILIVLNPEKLSAFELSHS